ncbi:MAG: hypothetical protein JXR19_03420 [Bacteroidia bacterium]
MKINTLPLVLLALCLSFGSCKEKTTTNNPDPDPTNFELITAHSWLLQDRWRDGVSLTPQYQACYMDNTHTYGTDGIYRAEEVGDLCDPPQGVISTAFEIREDDDSLFWGTDPYRDASYFKVTKLTSDILEFRMNYAGFLWEYQFVKQ